MVMGPLRTIAKRRGRSLVGLLLETIRELGRPATLLAVCPNSDAVTRAAIHSAMANDYPLLLAATLNQVDLDGGYTGWTPSELTAFVQATADRIGFSGDVAICSDHCGPYCKDRHRIENWPLPAAMWGARASLVACLQAGYDLLHVDPTIDASLPGGRSPDLETVVDRTVDLIATVERFRCAGGYPPVDYEVGTEEVQGGGVAEAGTFHRFLNNLRTGLAAAGLSAVWPLFVVGPVGTELHTDRFDSRAAGRLVAVAAQFGTAVKGHYTDGCTNLHAYPANGMGGANVGPELTAVEHRALAELAHLEDDLAARGRCSPSGFRKTLASAVVQSGRWKKWCLPDERGRRFDQLAPERREWMVQACSRYEWRREAVVSARQRLFDNLARDGIDGDGHVVEAISTRLDRYVTAFNLNGIASDLLTQLSCG
jgi:D-tagatose-1,6-bisphosphate aldolase subunit GatZ/KbaZ